MVTRIVLVIGDLSLAENIVDEFHVFCVYSVPPQGCERNAGANERLLKETHNSKRMCTHDCLSSASATGGDPGTGTSCTGASAVFFGWNPRKAKQIFGGFWGVLLEGTDEKLDEVHLCFRRGVESWYDINKTGIPLRGGFGRSSWSVSGCVSVQPVRSKPGC